jgi:hypothetical protein
MKHLQRHWAVMPEIMGQEYRGHATPAQLSLKLVSVSQATLELLAEVCHACPA